VVLNHNFPDRLPSYVGNSESFVLYDYLRDHIFTFIFSSPVVVSSESEEEAGVEVIDDNSISQSVATDEHVLST
jgi:hypothetical protein